MVRVGTHTSVAGGPEKAFARSAEVGGNTLQVFAKSPQGREIPVYTDEQFAKGVEERKKYNQVGGLVHSNYLANLSKPTDQIPREIASIVHDFDYAYRLWYEAVNVHVGKGKDHESRDGAMKNMAINVELILKKIAEKGIQNVQFLFENTAGQGSEIGSTLEELAYFTKHYLHDLPVKLTIDTAHCRGGGIDLTQRESFIDEFDATIGIDRLYAIHLNDSKVILGSKLDRHASLGRGFIGRKTLVPIIQRAAKHDRALYIETIEPELRPEEVQRVKAIVSWDVSRIDDAHRQYFKSQYLKKFEGYAVAQGGLF